MSALKICKRCRKKLSGGAVNVKGRLLCVECFNIENRDRKKQEAEKITVAHREPMRPTLLERKEPVK